MMPDAALHSKCDDALPSVVVLHHATYLLIVLPGHDFPVIKLVVAKIYWSCGTFWVQKTKSGVYWPTTGRGA